VTTGRRYRRRCCGVVLSAWYAVSGVPDGAMLLGHMTRTHPAEVGRFLDQMHTTDDITPVIVQTFEAVDEPGKETR
jgi:dissimilatory sulfite reductase (desulfoviridin) alpha/beta subunit